MNSKKFDFDIIIIGSGAAGSAAAFSAASAGLRVALVESEKWGGSYQNYLDIPFRAASTFAHSLYSAKCSARFGVSSGSLRFNYPTFRKWQASVMKKSHADNKSFFENSGIICLSGLAHFLSPYELSVGKRTYSAPKFLIASGFSLDSGNIAGLESCEVDTERTVFSFARLPKTLAIIGGGTTGVELSEYFSSLGVKVTLFELSARLLPREDEEVGASVSKYLEDSLRVHILTQSRVISVAKSSSELSLSFLRGGLKKTAKFEKCILATGHKPSLDLGLENAGVKYSSDGIKVDDYLQTSMKHIYAAGDCITTDYACPKPTELSSYEGSLAVSNLFNRQRNLVSRSGFIRTTNLYPTISCVGLTESECLSRNTKYKKSVVCLSDIPASSIEDFYIGFLKLLVDQKNRLIGASLVCPNSELLASELALAVRHSLSATELASSPVTSSSWSELIRLASRNLLKK